MLSLIIQILTVKTRRCLVLSVGLPACPSLLYSAFLDNTNINDEDQEVSRSVGRAACMSLFVI